MASNDYVTISRTTSNREPYQYVTVDVRRGADRVRFEMTLADFALAVTGHGAIPIDVTTWPEEVGDRE